MIRRGVKDMVSFADESNTSNHKCLMVPPFEDWDGVSACLGKGAIVARSIGHRGGRLILLFIPKLLNEFERAMIPEGVSGGDAT